MFVLLYALACKAPPAIPPAAAAAPALKSIGIETVMRRAGGVDWESIAAITRANIARLWTSPSARKWVSLNGRR